MTTTMSMTAAFITGVSGSLHCLGMCGGISTALGVRARTLGHTPTRTLLHATLYHAGRLLSYSLLGALGGAVGAGLVRVVSSWAMASGLRVAAGLFMMLLGCQLLFAPRLLAPLETLGYRVWRAVTPHINAKLKPSPQASIPGSPASLFNTLLLGAVWGWLPCGLVYSMLLLGVLGASPMEGAGIMLAFGAGTLPLMLSSSLFAGQWARAMTHNWRVLGGITLLVLGAWTSFVALHHSH